MEIYLIRHTTPLVEKGTCYGQADLDVTASFMDELSLIQQFIPSNIQNVYASPLQRCKKLALQLFPSHTINFHHDLKEISCGEWELQKWDDIPKDILMPWMNDFVNIPIPGGESYIDLYKRTTACFEHILTEPQPAVIVTHGGVMRSILSHITSTPLLESFQRFKIEYGSVVQLQVKEDRIEYNILHNVKQVEEQHRPSGI
jgi:alpha-ribazole phosphatase